MSDLHDPAPPPPPPPRPRPVPRQPPPARGGSFLGAALTLSVLLNIFFLIAGAGLLVLMMLFAASAGSGGSTSLVEKFHSGKSSAKDKIAVIQMDGILLEGLLGYIHKEIDAVGEDKNVKAVVLRIDSPGGSITASDDLYRRLVELRDGNTSKKITAKNHLVVSMGGIAASGGYYISMPAKTLVAERTSLTGSIGVISSLPNIAELSKKYGFKMEIIKHGAVKASGSMFKEMKPNERQVFQDMVDHAYSQFRDVVEEGRPKLKGKLEEKVVDKPMTVKSDDGAETFQYVRQRADGGVFSADEALKYGLIDKIGYLEDAIEEAKQAAGLGDDYKVVTYEKIWSLQESLLGTKAPQPGALTLDPQRLASAVTPRLWYLAPGAELAGILSATGH